MPCELLWEKVVRMRRMANSILNFCLICFSETKQLYLLPKNYQKNFVVVSELRKCLRFEAMYLTTELNINTKIAGGSNSSKQIPYDH